MTQQETQQSTLLPEGMTYDEVRSILLGWYELIKTDLDTNIALKKISYEVSSYEYNSLFETLIRTPEDLPVYERVKLLGKALKEEGEFRGIDINTQNNPVVVSPDTVDTNTTPTKEEPAVVKKKAKQKVDYEKGEFKKVYSRHLYSSCGVISLAQLKLSWVYSKLYSLEEGLPIITRVCDVDIKKLRTLDSQNLIPKDLSDLRITTKSKLEIRSLENKILDEDKYILIENNTLTLYKSVELIILHSVINQMKITGDKRTIKQVLEDKGLDILIGPHLQREVRSLKL